MPVLPDARGVRRMNKPFKEPKCYDARPCFARSDRGYCTILSSSYKSEPCPFCKPYQDKGMDVKDYPPEMKEKIILGEQRYSRDL